jgi:predicted component of type VI protein secretion system
MHSDSISVVSGVEKAGAAETLLLAVVSGIAAGKTFALGTGGVIGSDLSVDVAIDEHWISSRHARIRVDADGRTWLADLGSTYGTYVNGEWIGDEVRLRDGDKIRFGFASAVRFFCTSLAADPDCWLN